MWFRRMNAVSSTHLPGCAAATAGSGTRDAPAVSAATAGAASNSAPSTIASPRTAGLAVMATSEAARCMALFAQPHLDVAGRADVLADVAADALVVVGVDVAAGRRLLLGHAGDRGLRAVDDAVVAFEALAAAHAALRLGDRRGLGQRLEALLEVAERG